MQCSPARQKRREVTCGLSVVSILIIALCLVEQINKVSDLLPHILKNNKK